MKARDEFDRARTKEANDDFPTLCNETQMALDDAAERVQLSLLQNATGILQSYRHFFAQGFRILSSLDNTVLDYKAKTEKVCACACAC